MTDGAASILQTMPTVQPFANAFERLTSNDPQKFWTSGQWMTEKKGGSDVGDGTETLAFPQSDGSYKLYGYKWFTSATDANMAMTLARIVDKDGNLTKGNCGLTMFYLETRNTSGELNGLQIEKLKNKLGTRQMPTAEMILDGVVAHRVSEIGQGIRTIAPMLTVTRIHNSISATSAIRRMLHLAKDFAKKRIAFGKKLTDHRLHTQTLARIEVEQQASFLLIMEICHLLGRQETSVSTNQEDFLLRILTPLCKLYTGKQATACCSEGLEAFGGHGYLEDTGIPRVLRDAQVLSIWEGTTNILSLDVLRSVQKSNGEVLIALFTEVNSRLSCDPVNTDLQMSRNKLCDCTKQLQKFALASNSLGEDFMMVCARDFAYSLARVYIGSLLYTHAIRTQSHRHAQVALRWIYGQDLVPVCSNDSLGVYSAKWGDSDRDIVYGE